MWLCSELSLRGWSRGFRGGVKPLLANLCMTLCPSSSSWEWCWGAQQPDTAAQGTACPRPHFMHGETNWIASGLERAGGKGALQAEPGVSTRGSPPRVFPGTCCHRTRVLASTTQRLPPAGWLLPKSQGARARGDCCLPVLPGQLPTVPSPLGRFALGKPPAWPQGGSCSCWGHAGMCPELPSARFGGTLVALEYPCQMLFIRV